MQIDWTQIIIALVSAVLVPIIGVAVKALNTYLAQKAAEIKEKTGKDTLDKYVAIAQNLTTEVVDYLNTTMVNDMKEAACDGHLTREEGEQILEEARNKVLSLMSDTGKDALTAVYGDLESLLDMWITNAVQIAKVSPDGSGITAAQARQLSMEKKIIDTTCTEVTEESAG